MLNGSNFSEWKEHLLLVLALMDLDLSLLQERPNAVNHNKETERWNRSNRISMMIMRIRIPPKFKGIVPEDVTTAKGYLASVEKCYEISEISIVMHELETGKKKVNESVREYIMMKMACAAKLNKLGMRLPENAVADMVLKSLPSEYDCLKKAYIGLDKGRSTHELISQCVQVEERLKWDKEHDLVEMKSSLGVKKRKTYGE